MRRDAVRWVACPLVLALLGGCAVRRDASAPRAVYPLVPHRTRWAVDVEVGGRPFRFGLDTGGGVTLISADVAEAAGCIPWGRVTGYMMMGQRLDAAHCDAPAIRIGDDVYRPLTALVLAPELIESNDHDLQGSIGLDTFAGRALSLDFARGQLIVESPGSLAERVRDMTPLDVRLQREIGGRALSVFVAVPTERGALWMELDSGNGGTLLVSKPNAALLGLDSTVAGPQHARIEVAPGVVAESDHAFTPDMIVDGNLGMPFLAGRTLTLDLAGGKAWISPASADGAASS